MMQKEIEDSTITVPVPLHRELKIGTLQSIIRQSGLQTRQACLLGFIIFNPVTRQISDLLDDPLAFFLRHTFE
jgi:hypothetical protein